MEACLSPEIRIDTVSFSLYGHGVCAVLYAKQFFEFRWGRREPYAEHTQKGLIPWSLS
jgi:hypothetical protein